MALKSWSQFTGEDEKRKRSQSLYSQYASQQRGAAGMELFERERERQARIQEQTRKAVTETNNIMAGKGVPEELKAYYNDYSSIPDQAKGLVHAYGDKYMNNADVSSGRAMSANTAQAMADAEKIKAMTGRDNVSDLLAGAKNMSKYYDEAKKGKGFEYLTPDQKILKSKSEINKMSDEFKKDMRDYGDMLNFYTKQKDELGKDITGEYGAANGIKNAVANIGLGGIAKYNIAKKEDEIKEKYNLSDEELKKYLDYEYYISSAKYQAEDAKNYAIDPNASKEEKIKAGISNSVAALKQTPFKAIGGVASHIDDAVNRRTLGYNVNNFYMTPINRAEEAQRQVTENAIGGDTFGQKVGQFAYNTAMGTADAAINIGLGALTGAGEPLVLAQFAGQSYASTYKEAKMNGLSDQNANKLGVASAMIETGTELVSLDHLYDLYKYNKTPVKALVDVLVQGGIEASEETASTILNRIAEYMLIDNTGLSEMDRTIQNYLNSDPNMSEAEAKNKAEKDFWLGVAQDAAGGFFSGMALGAPSFAMNVNYASERGRSDRSELKEGYEGNADDEQSKQYAKNPIRAQVDMIDDSTEIGKDIKAKAMKYAEKYEKNGKLSKVDDLDLQNLLDADRNNVAAKANQLKRDIDNGGVTSGITEEEFRKGLVDAINSKDIEKISNLYDQASNSSSVDLRTRADEVMNQFKGKAENAGITAEQFESAKISAEQAYNAGLQGIEMNNLTPTQQESYNQGTQKKIENFNNEIKTKSETMPTELAKQSFIENSNSNIGADTYETAYNVLYKSAASGITFENVMKDGKTVAAVSMLGESSAKNIYNVGLADAKAEVDSKIGSYLQNNIGGMKKAFGTFKNVSNSASERSDINKIATIFAKQMNLDLVCADKIYNGDEGMFLPSQSAIWFTPDSAFATLMHEATGEYTKFWNPEGYVKMKEAVVNFFVETKGNDLYQKLLDEKHKTYKVGNPNQTIKESADELANDIFAHIFSTEEGAQELSRWMTEKYGVEESKTTLQKVADWFKKIANALKSMIAGSGLNDAQRALLNTKSDQYAKMAKDILHELDVAIENAQNFNYDEIKNAIGEEYEVVTDEYGDVELILSKDNSTILVNHSRATMEYEDENGEIQGTNKKLYDIMIKNGYNTFEAEQAVKTVIAQSEMLDVISKDYAEMAEALGARPLMTLTTDVKNSRQVFRSFVNNGEYPINVDFLTICKKRQAYMQVLNDLVDEGIFDKVVFDAKAIAKTNTILRDRGFETACLGCFVESRRLQIQTWANTFVDEWNSAVLAKNPNATPFPFSVGSGEVGNLSPADIMSIENEFKNAPKNKSGGLDLKGKSATSKMKPLIDIAPELAHTLKPGDLVKPSVLAKIRQTKGGQELFSLIRARYGSNTPKIAQEFNPYNSEVADLTPAYMANEVGNGVTGLDTYSKAIIPTIKNVMKGDMSEYNKYPLEVRKRIDKFIEEYNKEGKGSKNKDYRFSIRNENLRQISLAAYIYDVGGIRLQSFSDFMIENVMDYFQLVADAYAQNLPIHAYSKEIIFARIFGMTGMKINMSLIPEVIRELGKENAGLDANGNYSAWGDLEHHIVMDGKSFIQSIGYKDAIALQLDPRYEKNVGTIAIGVSDRHIKKMLNDPLIRMIIPYHSSGMNPEFAEAVGVDVYNDYTKVQNTRVKESLNGYDYDYIGKGTSKIKLLDCTYEFNGETITSSGEFAFNNALQRHNGDAKMAAKEYLAWCAAEHNMSTKVDVVDEKTGKTKEITVKDRVTLNPKFDSFAGEENYYKLLEDFNTYDFSENAARQSGIQMEYPNGLTAEQEKIYRQRLEESGVFVKEDGSLDKELIEKYVKTANMSLEELIKKEARGRNDYHRKQDAVYEETKSEIINNLKTIPENKSSKKNDKIDIDEYLYEKQFDPSYNLNVDEKEPIVRMEFEDVDNQIRHLMDSRRRKKQRINFSGKVYTANHVFWYEVYGRRYSDYDIIRMAKADSVEANIHEVNSVEEEEQKRVINQINEINETENEIYSRGSNLLEQRGGTDGNADISEGSSESYGRRDNGSSNKDNEKFTTELKDSDGNTLSSEQVERYKNSKARDKDGNLLVLYHGTRNEFYEFDRNRIGSSGAGSFEGAGFNFTPSESRARGYADGYVMKGYANVVNPLSAEEKTLTVRQLADIIAKADPTGDDIISNYAQDTRDYGKPSFIKREALTTARAIYEYAENDVDIYSNLSASGGRVALMEAFEELGYDGVIHYYDNGDIQTVITFNSNQFKDINNKKPTDSPHIMHSKRTPLSIAADLYELAFDMDDYGTLDAVDYDSQSEIDAMAADIDRGNTSYYENTLEDIIYDGGENANKARKILAEIRRNSTKSSKNTMSSEELEIFLPKVNNVSVLEEGLKALKGKPVDTRVINSIVAKLKNEFASTIDKQSFADMLSRTFAYLHNQDNITFNDVMSIFEEVAKPVIDNATRVDNADMYNDFVDYFKNYKIKLSDTQMAEIKSAYGSYADFKKAMYPLQFSTNGNMVLDEVWNTLAEDFPGLIEYGVNEGDMPMALADVLEAIKPSPTNTFGANAEEVGKDLAMRIVEEYLGNQSDARLKKAAAQLKDAQKQYRSDVRARYQQRYNDYKKKTDNLKKNALDKQKARYQERLEYQRKKAGVDKDWALADQRQRYENKFEAERADAKFDREMAKFNLRDQRQQYEAKLADIKAKSKDKMSNYKDRQKAAATKKQISKLYNDLSERIMKPTENKHVPTDMVKPLMEFLQCFNFVEPEVKFDPNTKEYKIDMLDYSEMIGNKNHNHMMTLTGRTKTEVLDKFYAAFEWGAGSKSQKRWQERLTALSDLFTDNYQSEDGLDDVLNQLNINLGDELKDLVKNNDYVISINNLSNDDLTTIKNALTNILHAINYQDMWYTLNQSVKDTAHDIQNAGAQMKLDPHSTLYNTLHKALTLDMMTPETFFTLLGDGGRNMYTSFQKAFEQKIKYIKQTSEFMEKLMEGIDAREWTGKRAEVKTFKFSEGELKLTYAQMMGLYELSKRQQAQLHYAGGLEASMIKEHRKEIYQTVGMHLSQSEMQTIFDELTPDMIKVADSLQKYMAEECGSWGNEASELMYGFKKFLDPKYYPITVDSNTNKSKNADPKGNNLTGLERSSFTKSVNELASNPIVIKDIFDVFTQHVVDMASYAAYAPTIKDALRVYNYKDVVANGDTKQYLTVKRAMNAALGRADHAGADYFEQFIRDVNGLEKSQEMKSAIDALTGHYKAAAVGGNLRVVIQQPTAYMRAAMIIDPKYLTKALPTAAMSKKKMEALKNAHPLIYWKSQGYYESNLGRSEKAIITGFESIAERVTDWSMWLAGKADDITWSCLYNAARMQIEDQNPGLSVDEKKAKVDELFSNVINETQVVDATIMKSPWQRNQSSIAKFQAAFMAEPIKSYNIAMKALIQASRGQIDKKIVAKAAAVLLATDMVNSLAQAIIDAIRNRDDDDEYYEQLMEYWLENMKDNLNPANRIPVVKDVWDILANKISAAWNGESTYGSSTGQLYEYAAIDTLADAISTAIKQVKGTYSKTGYSAYLSYTRALSQFTGVPAYNASRDAVALWNVLFANEDNRIVKQEERLSDKYDKVLRVIDTERSDEELNEAIQKMMEKEGTVKGFESKLTSKYKQDYLDALDNQRDKEAEELYDKAVRGFMAIGLSQVDAESEVESWTNVTVGYSDLDKAIQTGDGIELATKIVMGAKDSDKILDHLYNSFGATVEFNRARGYDSDVEDNLNKVLNIVDGINYNQLAIDQANKAREKAEKAAATEAKNAIKADVYESIDNGTDFRNAVNNAANSGMELSDLKSAITSQYKDLFIQAYKSGDYNTANIYRQRIAAVKAYCDQMSGLKIPKKYGGDYYTYELAKIEEWLKE